MKVAVIGAGTMGSGIAQAFAQCAEVEKVYLCDIKVEFAQGGFNKIKGGLDRMVGKGKMEQAAAKTPGISSVTVNFMAQKMVVEFAEGADIAAVMNAVAKNCRKVCQEVRTRGS